METPSYIKSLLMPNTRKPSGRKAWSIDLETVWLPFFTATNTVGDTHLPSEALGASLRLAYNPDGTVRFSKTGRPVVKVVKDLADAIRMVRDNFTAGLLGYTEKVIASDKQGYRQQVELARKAGEPILARDRVNLDKAVAIAMQEQLEKAQAEAQAEALSKASPKEQTKVAVPA